MFGNNLGKGTMKRTISTQPFVDNDSERVLIASHARVGLDLLRCHVCNGAGHILATLITRTLSYNSSTKVAEQEFILSPKQHIPWLDIPVNHFFIVRILQSISYLPDIADYMSKREYRTLIVALAYRTIWSVIHHQVRNITFHAE